MPMTFPCLAVTEAILVIDYGRCIGSQDAMGRSRSIHLFEDVEF